jgi:hypothetical protein
MKNVLFLALAGIGGFFIYKKFFNTTGVNSNDPLASPNILATSAGTNLTKDSQKRVDNQNQPYYGGSNSFQGKPEIITNLQNDAALLSAGASIIHSATDIWDDLSMSEWFGSSENAPAFELADNENYDFDSIDQGMQGDSPEDNWASPDYETAYA